MEPSVNRDCAAGTRTVSPQVDAEKLAQRQVPKVLIVDDHAMLRVGMRAILEADHIELEWLEAGTLSDAIELYRSNPGIALVLLDLNMPDCRGLQGLRQFVETFPSARIAVLSGTQDEFVIRHVRALGAVGYIAKGQDPQVMSQTVLKLLECGVNRDNGSGVPRSHADGFPPMAPSAHYDRVAELGARHLEILDLLLFGCSNQEISNATHLSLGTIKNYVSTILLALDVKSRSHLISLFR